MSGAVMSIVGTSVPRVDGPAKTAGTARYADDLAFPGMPHGRTIRATIPSGLVTGARVGPFAAGFAIVDHRCGLFATPIPAAIERTVVWRRDRLGEEIGGAAVVITRSPPPRPRGRR